MSPLDPSTPLRLVAGDRDALRERACEALHKLRPHLDHWIIEEDVEAILAALFPPLEPGEEPMTVPDLRRAVLHINFCEATWDQKTLTRIPHPSATRIEQEVRRATGE